MDKMSTIDFLQKALDLIKEAIDADNGGRYKDAYDLYFKGLDYYMLAIKCKSFVFCFFLEYAIMGCTFCFFLFCIGRYLILLTACKHRIE